VDNIYLGSLTVILCFLGYAIAWKWWFAGHQTRAVALLTLCGLMLRVFMSAHGYLELWDERFHALVAKNLMAHPLVPTLYDNPVLPYDLTSWTSNHVWLHKQPVTLWLMSLSMWVFGVNEFAVRLPSIMLTAVGIPLLFAIGRQLFNARVGFFAAFLFSLNGLVLELASGRTSTDHVDAIFMCMALFAVYFSCLHARSGNLRYAALVGVFLGLAILTKWLTALIVVPVWLLIVLDSKTLSNQVILRHGALLLGLSLIIALPWQLYIFHVFPQEAAWESHYNFIHLTEALEGHVKPIYYYLDKGWINFGEINVIAVPWFLWIVARNLNNLRYLAIAVWFIVPFVFFSFAATKMQAYLLLSAPSIFLMVAIWWDRLVAKGNLFGRKWVLQLCMVVLIAFPIRFTLERAKPFALREMFPQWTKDLKQLKTTQMGTDLLFNYPRPIEAMFYTDMTVYANLPDPETLNGLVEKGYSIIINDDGNLPAEIRLNSGLQLVRIHDPGVTF